MAARSWRAASSLHVDLHEAGRRVRLQLADQVHVGLWGPRGLLDCLQRRGERAEATLIRQRVDFAAARADQPVSVSCFCARGNAA